MGDHNPFDCYTANSSILADESDLASDIEADLQELPVEEGEFSWGSLRSTPFVGSFSSLLSEGSFSSGSISAVPSSDDASLHSLNQRPSIYLRTSSLKGVHTQLLNAQLKENCGSPSCISFQSYVVIGTNNGFIYVFDRRQKFCFSIDASTTDVGPGHGAITSLSQNLTGSRLLTGFASGRLAMWQLPRIDVTTQSAGSNGATNSEDELDDNAENEAEEDLASRKSKKQHTGGLLRIIDDAHQVGQSIIACAFTSLPTVAVSVDSSGSAYVMNFRRGLLGRSTNSACFFSGSHGEICAIAPLRPSQTSGLLQNYRQQPAFRALLGSAMVAMASFTKVIVVVLKPKFCVIFWQHLKGSPSCLPQLSWWWDCTETFSPEGESSVYLGFARTSTIHVARISLQLVDANSVNSVPIATSLFNYSGGRQFTHRFQLLRTFSLEHRIVSLHFFALNYLAYLDSDEVVRLYDISTEHEVESSNLATTQLCYNSTSFKALAIEGKVSEALACAGERACANSIGAFAGRLLVLGKNSVTMLVLKSWHERAIALFKVGRVEEALACCLQVSGCTRNQPEMKETLLRVLGQMPLLHSKKRPTSAILTELVQICVEADLLDFLQSSVIPAYRPDPLTYPLLLRSLCQYLLRLPPFYTVMSEANQPDDNCLRLLAPDVGLEMFKWCVHGSPVTSIDQTGSGDSRTVSQSFSELGHKRRPKTSLTPLENGRSLAQSCIVRFSPASLDIDKVLKFCLSVGLYQGFLYVYTYVLKDHEAAFRWLTDLLIKRGQSPSERETSLPTTPSSLSTHSVTSTDSEDNLNTTEAVNAIILFLRSCFAGEEVFGIPLEPQFYSDVPNKIFNLLLSNEASSPEVKKTLLVRHTSTAKALNCAVPRMRVLLHFGGAVDMLNMLTLALRESPFFSLQQSSMDISCQRRQRLLNALVSCALDEHGESIFPVGTADLTRLICFVGEQILLPENAALAFDDQKIMKMLRHLSMRTDVCEASGLVLTELSDVLYRLFLSERLNVSADILKVAENIGLSDFCEQVYRRQGNLVAVLSCLLSSLRRVTEMELLCGAGSNTAQVQELVSRIFVFLTECFTSSTSSEQNKASAVHPLVNCFLENVELYARCDALRCLLLLLEAIGPSMRRILCALDTVFMNNEPLPSHLLQGRSLLHEAVRQPGFDDFGNLSVEGPHHPADILLLEAFYELLHSEMPEVDRESAEIGAEADTELRLQMDELLSKPDPLVAELYVRLLLTDVASGNANSASEDAQPQLKQSRRGRESLCRFLTVNVEYRASVLLELFDEATYPQELACIYEKIGDTAKASELLKKDFLSHWSRLLDCPNDPVKPNARMWSGICEVVRTRAQAWFVFTARQCSSRRCPANEAPWFAIIDTLSALRKREMKEEVTAQLNNIFYELLESASPYVLTPALINRVLQMSETCVSALGASTRGLLVQLAGAWQREAGLLRECRALLAADAAEGQRKLAAALLRGAGLHRYVCPACGSTFARRYRLLRSTGSGALHPGGFTTLAPRSLLKGTEILILRCGHGMHVDCYTACRELYKTRLATSAAAFVCLQCTGLIDPTAPTPLASIWSRDDPSIDRPLAPPPAFLQDAHDEILVSTVADAQPSQNSHQQQQRQQPILHSPQLQKPKSTNPFGDDDDDDDNED